MYLDYVLGDATRGQIVSLLALLSSVQFMSFIDITIKIIALIATVSVSWYAIISYKERIKNDRLERQIKEQQLADMHAAKRRKDNLDMII